jgi:non-canonical poly(A) RNA polymerase PAPD5/7
MDRMAEEIDRFYHFSKPNPDEVFARQHVIEQVREHVRKILPNHSLEVFGSERTGLAFATSDIDLRLVKNSRKNDSALPPSNSQRTKAKSDLKKLYWNGVSRNGLSRHKAYILPQLRHARYPLIALQDRQSGLDIQIVLGNDTSLSREMIERYTTQYPYLRPLYAVVKTMFDVRGLTDVFRGGFGSYTLFMMIVASIRHNPSPRNDAAGGLLNFLRFYRSFDTSEKGLSIEPVCTFDKQIEPVLTDTVKHKLEVRTTTAHPIFSLLLSPTQEGKTQPLPPYMLSLRDPADETNDLGRKAIAIKHVQATFKKLCHDLDRNNVLNTRASLLGPLVGTSYMLNKEARFKLQNYGKRLSEQVHKSLAAKAKMIREQDGSKDEEKMSLQRDPDQWESLPA